MMGAAESKKQSTKVPSSATATLRVLHLSDTHNMHRFIETTFGKMPEADILIHTGDFTNDGTDEEFEDFHSWLMEIKAEGRYPRGMYVIPGNHDWRDTMRKAGSLKKQVIDPTKAMQSDFMQKRLPGVKVLYHETVSISVQSGRSRLAPDPSSRPEGSKEQSQQEDSSSSICSREFNIYGIPWEPWHEAAKPENGFLGTDRNRDTLYRARESIFKAEKKKAKEDEAVSSLEMPPHRYNEIPDRGRIHLLITHGPPRRLLDSNGGKKIWGGSDALFDAINLTKPLSHCFGHSHACNGFLLRSGGPGTPYFGGNFYRTAPPKSEEELLQPAAVSAPATIKAYPCDLLSNNSMCNHWRLEGLPEGTEYLKNPPRLIVASWSEEEARWKFSIEQTGQMQQFKSGGGEATTSNKL